MTSTTPGWELYRSFLAVLKAGTLSGAARALRLTQPTVGRHVDALERTLGLALFTRSLHGLVATDAALELRPHAEAMAAAADTLIRVASGSHTRESGTVRVSASEIVGAEVLPAILAEFRLAHPRLRIELVLSNDVEDLVRRDADIAVRMTRPMQSVLLARRIGCVPVRLHAHRDYLDRRGTPTSVEQLMSHDLVGFDVDDGGLEGATIGGFMITRELFSFRSDNHLAQLAAVRAGLGIGVCQSAIAARTRDLVPILSDALQFDIDMWLAMHKDLRGSRPVRQLYDHLARGLEAYVETPIPTRRRAPRR